MSILVAIFELMAGASIAQFLLMKNKNMVLEDLPQSLLSI